MTLLDAPPASTVTTPRRSPLRFVDRDMVELAGCGASAALLVWAVFHLFAWNAPFGFVLCSYAVFIAMYRMVVRENRGAVVATDRVALVVISSGAIVALIPLFLLLAFVVQKGSHAFSFGFFTNTMDRVGPLDPLTKGGGAHAVLGTLLQVGIASLVSVPLAVLTAVYLNEIGGRMARYVRFVVDAMSGVPSIIAGLFIFIIWVIHVPGKGIFGGLGKSYSGAAAAAALTILMLPTVTRTVEEILRTVPDTLREASLALGAPEWRTVAQVVLPTARSGIVTGAILGVARAVGETAPVILTAFGANAINANPFKDPQADLPLYVYRLFKNQQRASELERAFTGALMLVAIVLVLFIAARVLGGRRRKVRT